MTTRPHRTVEERLRTTAPNARVTPPAGLRRRIITALNDTAVRRPLPNPPTTARRSAGPRLTLLMASLALAAAVLHVLRPGPATTPDPTPADVAVAPAPAETPARIAPEASVDRGPRVFTRRRPRSSPPTLTASLADEARNLLEDARRARRFVLAQLPSTLREVVDEEPASPGREPDGPVIRMR